MNLAYVDANVILRLLTDDPPSLAERAQKLLDAVDQGEIRLFIPDIVLAEIVWVLHSFYKYSAQQISELLYDFLSHEGLVCGNKAGLLQALKLFSDLNIDFADALVAVQMEDHGIRQIYSFDQHFDRIADIVRLSPAD